MLSRLEKRVSKIESLNQPSEPKPFRPVVLWGVGERDDDGKGPIILWGSRDSLEEGEQDAERTKRHLAESETGGSE